MSKPVDKCIRCKQKFKLSADNTVVYIYTNPNCEDFNYFTAVCTKCETKNWTFMYEYFAELIEIARQTECEIVTEPYPSEQILVD